MEKDGLSKYKLPIIIKFEMGKTGVVSLSINDAKTKYKTGLSGFDKHGFVLANFINDKQGTDIDGKRGFVHVKEELEKQGYKLTNQPSTDKDVRVYLLEKQEISIPAKIKQVKKSKEILQTKKEVSTTEITNELLEALRKIEDICNKYTVKYKKMEYGGNIDDNKTAKVLIISDRKPLSKQLLNLTGKTYNMQDFEDIEKNSDFDIIREKSSGDLYLIFTLRYIIDVSADTIFDNFEYIKSKYGITKIEHVTIKTEEMAEGGSIISESPKDIWNMNINDFFNLKIF